VQLLARDRAHAHAPVRNERDEPERSEPSQRLANRCARHVELLGKLLLAKDRPGSKLSRNDGLLDDERDVVGLGGVERHSRRVYAGSVRKSSSSGASASSAKSSFASSPASTPATSSRSRSSWFGLSPSTASNTSVAIGTRSGCATQVPSNPLADSRSLSSRTLASATLFTSGSLRDGMKAAMPPIACAPRL